MRRRFINTKSFEKNKITCTLKPKTTMVAHIYGDYFDDSQITSMRVNGVLVEKRPCIEVALDKEYVIEITFGELYSLSNLFFETNVISVSGLETLDTKNVIDMESTFSRVNFNIPNLDMWDISNVQTMRNMFDGNDHITSSPFTKLHDVLPSDRCYESMFYNCRGLIKAPELPAKILTQSCYYRMFYNCSNLNYIKMLATDISASGCLSRWVHGVPTTGTFVKSKDATWNVRGESGIPDGWTVVNDGEEEGGNDFGIEFPLYLEFDHCDVYPFHTYCERAADELGVKVYNCVKEIVDEYGEFYDWQTIVGEQVLDMLGIEIYFENSKVIGFYNEGDTYSLQTNHNEYHYVNIDHNGLIFYEA